MITEEGVVKRILGNKATVLARRGSMCESCGQKAACSSLTSDNKDVEIEAINTVNAEIGDRVSISIESSSLLKITTLVYLFPVISLIIGVIAGQKLGEFYSYDPEISSLLSGVALFLVTFLIIKMVATRLGKQKKYSPEITKIIYKSFETPESRSCEEKDS